MIVKKKMASILPSHFYIVDSNIIISYMKNENILVTNLINNPENRFFYTETVLKEVKRNEIDIPERFQYVDIDMYTRINSCLDDIEKGLRLTPIQFRNFKNDLTVILEAGWICNDVTPENDYNGASLLTNNIKLLKKFISNVGNRESLEEKINLNGLEHLIDIVTLKDIY